MHDTRIALVVANCPVGAVDDNLADVARWATEAARAGAKIVCFPELNLTGYSVSADVAKTALPVPGPVTAELVRIAHATSLTILAGLAEKDREGRIFATHLVVTPQGLSGSYRKVHLAPPERPVFSPGQSIPLFSAEGLIFGIQLCYDSHFPELSTAMALEGCDLIFMPHASPRGTPDDKLASWMRHLTARAFDNAVFIAACNQFGDNRAGLGFPGVAVVIKPSGKVLRQFTGDKEVLLVTDLRADRLSRVRGHRMRYFLPHRRPDVYRL
ncbi:MAG: nitrilase-related carbon-nitrogen hydrolase [Desulfobacterales bacterium]